MRQAIVVGFVSLALVAPLQAVVFCDLSATPALMRAGGLTEPLGEIVIQCGGGMPSQPVAGSFRVTVDTLLGNRVQDGLLPEVTLAVSVGGAWHVLPGVKARLQTPNEVFLEGLDVPFEMSGNLAFRVAGLRGETDGTVMAFVGFNGNLQLPMRNPVVTVGRGPGLSLGASGGTTLSTASVTLPAGIDFQGLFAARVPFLTTRITEADAAVLVPKRGASDHGTRVLVRFAHVAEGGRMLAPEAVAGYNAMQPTSGGDMGLARAAGMYIGGGAPSLLLARVHGADANGAGGAVTFTPEPGLNTLGAVGPLDFASGVHYVVYEVLDADPGAIESAQFPAWVVMPPEFRGVSALVRQTVSLAPVSETRGPSETAPVPRFAANVAANDCPLRGDCGEVWFPRLRVLPNSPTQFTAQAGSVHQIGYLIVENASGGILEWRVSVRYLTGSDWVRIFPAAGAQKASVRFDVLPEALAPGVYEADVVVTGLANAGEGSVRVRLTVTAGPPPPPVDPPPAPAPRIVDVTNAAHGLPGPVAPGSLVLITGEHFGASSRVTVGGIEARVVVEEEGELVIEVPPELPVLGWVVLQVQRGAQRSEAWGIEVVAVAPAVLFARNEDGAVNDEENPAVAGSVLELYVTGIRLAAAPVAVRIHDRDITELLEVEEEPPAGVDVLRFRIPPDLPAMSTAVVVCAEPEGAPGERRCAHPFDVLLLARE